jgi:hypothetical protein
VLSLLGEVPAPAMEVTAPPIPAVEVDGHAVARPDQPVRPESGPELLQPKRFSQGFKGYIVGDDRQLAAGGHRFSVQREGQPAGVRAQNAMAWTISVTPSTIAPDLPAMPPVVPAHQAAEPEEAASGEMTSQSQEPQGDDELGVLRVREQGLQVDDELGLIRIRDRNSPVSFPRFSGVISGQAGFFGGSNLFQSPNPLGERVFQTGIGLYLFPQLSPSTNLFVGAAGNVVRYTQFPSISYDETELQAGVRQRLSRRAYGQLYWRHKTLYQRNGEKFFQADHVELLLSRRDVLGTRVWLDSFYQIGFRNSKPSELSRFSQFLLLSLSYGFTPQARANLAYQLYLDDYTRLARYDTYHQVIGQISYDLSPLSSLNLFGGFKFGRSSEAAVQFDDIIYGVSFSFNGPVF